MRKTKARNDIMNLLETKKEPQSAEMIINFLDDNTINLSTVYRTLDTFLNEGLVTKTIINNKAYYTLLSPSHHHYLVCLNCNKMIEIDCHLDRDIDSFAKNNGFTVRNHDLTIYGLCNKCNKH